MAKKSKRMEQPVQAAQAEVTTPLLLPAKWMWLAMAALAAACMAIYLQTATHSFVNLDDFEYIVNNPNVRGGLTAPGIAWAFTTISHFYWQPFTWLSHMLDCQLFGLNAGPHHLVSMVLHAVNSVLLLSALFLLTGKPGRSAFGAAIFALHPLRVESVAWAAERKDVLSGLFWILTMAAYAFYVKAPSVKRYALLFAAALFSAMSKPTVVTLPLALLLLDFWPLGRLDSINAFWARLKEKVPLLAISAVLSVITYIGQKEMGATINLQAMPLHFRIENAIVSYGSYLQKFFWPSDLSVFYPMHRIDSAALWGTILLIAAVTAGAIWKAREYGYFLTGWLWFLGALVPMLGLAQTGAQSMADRFTYLPSIGLSIALCWLAADFRERLHLPIKTAAAACCLFCAALAYVSFQQTAHWKSSFTLFEHSVAVTQDNDFLHGLLSALYRQNGRLDLAASHIEEVIRIEPKYEEALAIAVRIYAQTGQPEKAIVHLRKLAALQPTVAGYRRSLADALWRTGKLDEARGELDQAIRLDPGDLEAKALRMMMNTP